MDKELKLVVERWITGAAPESFHNFDMKRFYDVIFQSLLSNEKINSEYLEKVIREKLKWHDKKIEEFATEKAILLEVIIGFIEYLKSQKGINIYNQL